MSSKKDQKKSSKNRYRLLGNSHSGPGTGKKVIKYIKGDVIETTQNLCEMFPNKFKKLGEDADVKPTVKTDEEKEQTKPTDEVDATAKFEASIGESAVTVAKKGKFYLIRDADDKDAGVLNEPEELTSQAKVTEFIKDYLAD